MPVAPEKLWWTAAELAEANLPDVPNTKFGVSKLAKREAWDQVQGGVRRRKGRGGGLEYYWTVLPVRARAALVNRQKSPVVVSRPDRDAAWAAFDSLNDRAKEKARVALDAIQTLEALDRAGVPRTECARVAAQEAGVSEKTVWNWLSRVEGVAPEDRLPYLAPQHQLAVRKVARNPIDDRFFALVKSDFLRPEQPSLTSCYDRAVRIAKSEGLEIAPIHQVRRHYKASVSRPTEIYLRKGAEALRRFYPHQTRDKSALAPLDCIQGDFHKFDVFVKWPGEALPVRPQIVVFSDVHSGKVLSWRLSLTANSHTVQLAIGDVIERFGIPKAALLDNGREFAAKAITGGTQTRFRFAIRDDDIPGLLPMLGVQVHWATPYSGQSKPIERAFLDFCDRIARHPAFEGAYTGNRPDAKPENYGNAAVPIEEFRAILVDELQLHNARPNRRSEVANGRSFDEVFNTGFKIAAIRKATAEQRRLWLLSAEGLVAGRGNGELKIHGSRYWSPWMHQVAGQKVVARFDPDDLFAGLHVYDLNGLYLGHAETVARGDFLGVEDAREHARKRSQYLRAAKEEARAVRDLSAAEIAARLRAAGTDAQADALPEAQVVALPQPHPSAPKPVRDTAQVAGAPITSLADRRGQPRDDGHDTPEARWQRARDLEQLAGTGTLTPDQASWLAEYQLSAEYRGHLRAAIFFGTEQ